MPSLPLQFELSIATFVALAIFAIVQAVLVLAFLRALRHQPTVSTGDEKQPKVALILCLRGGDPFLDDCIQAILNQDYPNYDVHIVIDHQDDPARQIVDAALAKASSENVFVQFLTDRLETCSLKCSSLVQVVSQLDESYDVMAQLDADTIAHRTWLRELVGPMREDDVGATTGNRWYMPDDVNWGTMVRWLWNAAAVVQMYCYRIPWGGTLAIKMDVVRQSDLLTRWSHGFCEDTMLAAFLKQRGQRVQFVPSLLMINRESCGLSDFTRWVSRQLLTARLYHPSWPLVAGHAILSSFLMAAAFVLCAIAIATNNYLAATLHASGLIVYQVSNFFLLWRLESAACRIVKRRGETCARFTLADLFKLPLAVVVTQTVYVTALLRAVLARTVAWRGAVYEIRGKRVQLLEDCPFSAEEEANQSTMSL